MIGFIIWCLVGWLFIVLGIVAWSSKKPAGFWSNVKMCEVQDVRKYNHAMGKLWCIAGAVFIVLGIPLLAEQNSAIILLSVIGALIWVITLMVIYELGIMKKYRKE